ncbi:type IV pili methyl-accepting chemotaxis transducer N-terminal domain-containing protein [Sphaerotilus hippei]|nr:type IV pili methyl-accepting chemotaxis transducer N-terminal domain-containing protein [Sphaerotilus hippei]
MTSVLLAASAAPCMPELSADLRSVGLQVLGQCECHVLVREAVRLAPDVVVIWEPLPGDELFESTRLLAAAAARPVLVFTSDVRAEPMEQALASGVQGWVVNGYAPERLRPLIQLAQARFRVETTLRGELAEVNQRYSERKLVDRAKGILMSSRRVNEEEAFRLLRTASMQNKMRMGQVSQQVIDAVHYADAINRAGRLRMLSQRIVKLYALLVAGVEAAGSRALLADSRQQAEQLFAGLGRSLSRPTFGDLIEAAEATWALLRRTLDAPVNAVSLVQVDALGEDLLLQAERLTAALTTAGPVTNLQVINVSGRQRMLTQRLAKQALLASLSGPVAEAELQQRGQTRAAFEQSLGFLRDLPLSNGSIREALTGVDRAWQTMLKGEATMGTHEGRMALAASSEDLLELFDRLTGEYERGLQLLIG